MREGGDIGGSVGERGGFIKGVNSRTRVRTAAIALITPVQNRISFFVHAAVHGIVLSVSGTKRMYAEDFRCKCFSIVLVAGKVVPRCSFFGIFRSYDEFEWDSILIHAWW